MKISHTFGTFIKEKRQQRDISLRKFADQIGISPVYLSNLENDRMPAPKDEVVSTMARSAGIHNGQGHSPSCTANGKGCGCHR